MCNNTQLQCTIHEMMLSGFAAYRAVFIDQDREPFRRYKATLILRLTKLMRCAIGINCMILCLQ
jgi:hypothetical protein